MEKLKIVFKDGYVNQEEVRKFVESNGDVFEHHFIIDPYYQVRLLNGYYNPGEDESIIKENGEYKVIKN